MRGVTTPLNQLERILRATPLPRTPEVRLQDGIAACLTDHGFAFVRERRLTNADVIDFLVDGSVGLEVKVDGSLSEVTRQLHRYAQSDCVKEILLITTRSKHRALASLFAGKPVRVLHLIQGSL